MPAVHSKCFKIPNYDTSRTRYSLLGTWYLATTPLPLFCHRGDWRHILIGTINYKLVDVVEFPQGGGSISTPVMSLCTVGTGTYETASRNLRPLVDTRY